MSFEHFIDCDENTQKIINRIDQICYEQIDNWAATAKETGIDGFNALWMWNDLCDLVDTVEGIPANFSVSDRIGDIINSAIRAGVIKEVR